jgi:hypothetical protein
MDFADELKQIKNLKINQSLIPEFKANKNRISVPQSLNHKD